jgi:hypothetical protein
MSLERFQWLKDQFSDEIPDKVLQGRGNFKVRRNWWQGLVGDLERGLRNGVVPEELRPDVEQFLDHYTSEEFHNQSLTTEADIQRANGLLSRILGRKQG